MPNQAFIKKLDEIIEANLTNEQFGVSQLASEMGMSRSNLHRRLNSITNTSVSQYVRQARLKQATNLLQDGSLTVSEVAFRVGFGSVTYFSKCFRDYYGFTPGTAVKNNLFDLENTDNVGDVANIGNPISPDSADNAGNTYNTYNNYNSYSAGDTDFDLENTDNIADVANIGDADSTDNADNSRNTYNTYNTYNSYRKENTDITDIENTDIIDVDIDNTDIVNDEGIAHNTEQFTDGNCAICGKSVANASVLNEQIIEVNPKPNGKRRWRGVYLILLVTIILTASLYNFFSPFSNGSKTNDRTIAVLPFVDNSPEGNNTYFMNGINEEIRIKLDRIENLKVKSPTAVEEYKDSKLTVSEIARNLNVHYILSGSGQKIRDTMRIRFQLIDVDSGNELWSKPYQEEVNDKNSFKIQEQLAFSVANELKFVIANPEKSN